MPGRLPSEAARLCRVAADHASAGRKSEAVLAWEAANALSPGHGAIAIGLGAALLDAGRVADAVRWLSQAAGAHAEDPEVLRLLARALNKSRKRREAAGALFAALELAPESAGLHEDLGYTLYNEEASALALPHARYAFAVTPNISTGALLISVLLDLGRREEALEVIAAAPERGADRSEMLVLQSLWLQTFGHSAEAIAAARESVALAPSSDVARHQLGALLLLNGQLTPEAWSLYESRAGLLTTRQFPAPERRWRGERLEGRTLLIHAEQGFGDTLQFVRYVPLAAERAGAARVVVAVQPALTRLLQGIPGADSVIAGGGSLPGFDVYAPMLCLPGILGTTLATIPPALPYAMEFGALDTGRTLRVGLVWSGNPDFSDDRRRSIKPEQLAPLADVRGIEFWSLQFGAVSLPVDGMVNGLEGVRDFADTARRIASLDLVITVDTGVAHLAATMGKPVWMMSRLQGCWRWLLDRADTPWYPSMRIYRQTTLNDWAPVIGQVQRDLADWVAARQPQLVAAG